jgi:hypothetical protein
VIGDDLANVVVVTKLADGRPVNAAAAAMASGTDGTIAATDFNTPLSDMTAEPETGVVLVPQAYVTAATVNGYIVTQSANVSDRLFLTWSSDHTNTANDEVTDIAAQITTRSDRIVWCYNSPWTNDPELGIKIQTPPHVWMASILSQTDVDVNPGSAQCGPLLTGIARLYNPNLSRGDLKSLKNAGVSDAGEAAGRVPVPHRASPPSLTRGQDPDHPPPCPATSCSCRRPSRLRFYVKAINTPANRGAMIGELVAFSSELRSKGRIVQDFAIDSESVNTEAQRAEDIEQILWRVKLIGHMNSIVLQTEIGTDVTITEAAA